MVQTISISLTHGELSQLINEAVFSAIDKKLKPAQLEELLTEAEAREYLKCSGVFLWKRRREGKIQAVNAGKKVLYPKSSLNEYLQLKKRS